jgi:hypothetical protein
MILLELIEKYGADGWQDDEGAVHYDHEFTTPFGKLGSVVVEKCGGEWVINRADDVVLFGRGLVKSLLKGSVKDECTHAVINDWGFIKVYVQAKNGFVIYQVHEDELSWSDTGKVAECYLATKVDGEWSCLSPE